MTQTRIKETLIDQTRTPVSLAVPNHPTIQWYVDLHGKDQKLEFGELTRLDTLPIPMPVDREGYQPDSDFFYWSTGHLDWLNLDSAIREFEIPPRQKNHRLRILDVGCSTGRVLRHIHNFGNDRFEIWGSDLAPANIAWMQRHMPKEWQLAVNTVEPVLPYPDNYFDVVTGFSLLPHIDSNDEMWLVELGRITRPGGLLYLTFGNEATWSDSAEREHTIRHFENTNSVPGNLPFDKTTFQNPLSVDRLVRRVSRDEVYNCFIWRKNDFVMRTWGKLVEILRLVDRAHLKYQAVMLARPIEK